VKRLAAGAEAVTAIHEAGHAVIAAAARVGNTRVTIVADGDSAGANHWTTPLESEALDGRFLKRLAVLMAGSITTCRATGDPPAWTTGGGVAGYAVRTINGRRQRVRLSPGASDLDQATAIVLHLEPSDDAEQLRLHHRVWQWTAAEVRVRWPEIVAVAKALLQKRTLSGRSVLRIIRRGGRKSGPLAAALSALMRERRLARARWFRAARREWDAKHPVHGEKAVS
jgi:hypothetical protein